MKKVEIVIESPIGSNSDMNRYIDSVNEKFGLKGQPWCAMALSDVIKRSNANYPKIWSAKALSFATAKIKYTLKQVANDEYKPKPGDIVVYNYGAGLGHVDIVVSYDDGNWLLVGANRDDRVALWKGSTNNLIAKKAIYVVDVSGNYKCETNNYKLEKKLATVYNSYFNGRRMANGEIYNEWNYTVASNDYPLNSILIIYNMDKTDSAIVKVTDRMKYNNRIDLSKALSAKFKIRKDTILVKYMGM